MRPLHPEQCPKCGTWTFNWWFLQNRIHIKCETCGFEDNVSNTPMAGSQVSSESRTPIPRVG